MKNGDKDIQIGINNFTILLEMAPLLKLSWFSTLDSTVNPPSPVYIPSLKEKLLKKTKTTGSNMYIRIKTSDIVICTPTAETKNILAIKGEFLI
jgi:hypothetical protein